MKTLKAIIIDDEGDSREIIREYLEEFENIVICDECADGFSGLKAINKQNPDIVFLDVQMPKLNGIELLEVLQEEPAIIFTTAYDQYAIHAFEKNAVDYLLKPFPINRFREAVHKAIARINSGSNVIAKEKIAEQFAKDRDSLNRIVVKNRGEIEIIDADDIWYIQSEDDYVMIHLKDKKYLKNKTMKYYEENLDKHKFVRVHRSYIVKIDRIKSIETYEKSNGIIILKDSRKIYVSRSGLSRLKDILDL